MNLQFSCPRGIVFEFDFSVNYRTKRLMRSACSCVQESFLRSVLESMEIVYVNRNPTAKAVLDLVRSAREDQICYDHLAFRTFGVIHSLF